MNQNIKNRLKRTAILCLLAFAIMGGITFYQIQNRMAQITPKPGQTIERPVSQIAGLNIGGPFNLIDHNGNEVTEKDYEDKHKLIYFGFTYCPAICPTELQKMVRVLKELGPAADDIQPLFITIDPERDTPEVMHEYVKLFQNENLIGLTGTQPQIDFVTRSYRIFATKVQEEGMQDYTVDHSSFTYLMSPDNKLMSIYRIKDSVDFMTQDILSRLPKNSDSDSDTEGT